MPNGDYRPKFDWTVNLGTVIEITTIIVLATLAWASIGHRLEKIDAQQSALLSQVVTLGKAVQVEQQHVQRIELYLSERDSERYWKAVEAYGRAMRAIPAAEAKK